MLKDLEHLKYVFQSKVTVAPSMRQGAQILMCCAGLGGLDVNSIVMPFLNLRSKGVKTNYISNWMRLYSNIYFLPLFHSERRVWHSDQ
jgi:hypothetical protein